MSSIFIEATNDDYTRDLCSSMASLINDSSLANYKILLPLFSEKK